MFESLATFIKNSLVPGTMNFLLCAMTVGLVLAYGPRRTRRFAIPFLTALAAFYWLGSIPILADLLATRFHARTSRQVTLDDVAGAQAIVVLGAGIRNAVTAAGHTVATPDFQTIWNAVEGARIYRMFPGGIDVVASGGHQDGVPAEATESLILQEWLLHAGVPADRIVLESRSRTTREQAIEVAPIVRAHQWQRVVLVAPAAQMPRAVAVFRRQGLDPIPAAAPFRNGDSHDNWMPNGGALRITERSTYDYLAWAYYWVHGWL